MCKHCEEDRNCLCLCNIMPRVINVNYLDSDNKPCSFCELCKHNSSYKGHQIHLEDLKLRNISIKTSIL